MMHLLFLIANGVGLVLLLLVVAAAAYNQFHDPTPGLTAIVKERQRQMIDAGYH